MRYDCGSKLGYLKATVEFGLRHPETGTDFAAYLVNRFGAEAASTALRDAEGACTQGSANKKK